MKALTTLILVLAIIGASILFTGAMNIILNAVYPPPGVSWCGHE